MKRTLVNIISEQTIPNYIFIKEMIQPGDSLMFISSKKMEERIGWITNVLDYKSCQTTNVIFEQANDEEKWSVMCTIIKNKLDKNVQYIVNLTGGTKYMSLAVQKTFEEYNSLFYYIPFPKNYILSPSGEKIRPIEYRITIDEYLRLYNIQQSDKCLIAQEDYTNNFFDKFINQKTLNFNIIDKLRAYRDVRKSIIIKDIENKEDEEKKPKISGLANFIEEIQFPCNEKGQLSKYEIQYLTGGWFEEYVYNLVKKHLTPTDIELGVLIQRGTTKNYNDLDVVFTLGNKLFVIECKTGVEKESLFKEFVYKASALRECLLGLSANSYIFSLSIENATWEQAANNMGIKYCSREMFVNMDKMEKQIKDIKTRSYEE